MGGQQYAPGVATPLKLALLLVAAFTLLGSAADDDAARNAALVTAVVRAGLSNDANDFIALRTTYHSDAEFPYYDTNLTQPPYACTSNDGSPSVRHEQIAGPFPSDNWQLFCGGRVIEQPYPAAAETLRRSIAKVVPSGFSYDRTDYAMPIWSQMTWRSQGVRVLLEVEPEDATSAHYDVAVIHDAP